MIASAGSVALGRSKGQKSAARTASAGAPESSRDAIHQINGSKQRNGLSADLFTIQDQERRHIARELHDGVGQLLVAMRMNAFRLEQESAKLTADAAHCLQENSRLIDQALSDIRTMSYLFHPPLLDEMGLHFALKWYVKGFAERSEIATKLELPADGARLPRDHEFCLFRIVQECLINIHRHSGSSTALVRLFGTSREIKLQVRDEGRGLDRETQAKIISGATGGVGLRGMKERVGQLGGSMEIGSNGKGTTVTATLPLKYQAEGLPVPPRGVDKNHASVRGGQRHSRNKQPR